ncbi:MAG: endolytic transglycosylase MltG [Desulfobacterales bacterium]
MTATPQRHPGEWDSLKKWFGIILLIGLLALAAGWLAYVDLMHYAAAPAEADGRPEKKLVAIEKGQNFKQTTLLLQSQQLIEHPIKFRLLARLQDKDKQIQAGEYLLSADMPPGDILKMLVNGKVRLYKFTIPEGSTLKQIAAIVETAGLVTRAEFLSAAADADFVRENGIDADSFEGYLFPETYFFPKNTAAREVIAVMVDRLRSVFTETWEKRAADIGLSVHQVLTLASIIEKETGASSERPIISSVFHNRLRRGMRLETDPTVIYGIDNFDGNLTRKHLATPTPYNTYLISGLPPGPIASPGRAAIEATLYPADTRYLYFVSKKDGTHQFSKTFADHNRAILTYQLKK